CRRSSPACSGLAAPSLCRVPAPWPGRFLGRWTAAPRIVGVPDGRTGALVEVLLGDASRSPDVATVRRGGSRAAVRLTGTRSVLVPARLLVPGVAAPISRPPYRPTPRGARRLRRSPSRCRNRDAERRLPPCAGAAAALQAATPLARRRRRRCHRHTARTQRAANGAGNAATACSAAHPLGCGGSDIGVGRLPAAERRQWLRCNRAAGARGVRRPATRRAELGRAAVTKHR